PTPRQPDERTNDAKAETSSRPGQSEGDERQPQPQDDQGRTQTEDDETRRVKPENENASGLDRPDGGPQHGQAGDTPPPHQTGGN
ncbi:hypothetical protein, partial [Nonomuraea antri]|uniref:hypothetical protein n=1 Tax=Nonomuraea antri TaxID=2730852 RepID=UPI001C2B8AF7